MIRLRRVKIKCPVCEKEVFGVEDYTTLPWPSFYGHCQSCNYHITESEWEVTEVVDEREGWESVCDFTTYLYEGR